MQQLKIVEEFINRNKIKTKVIACKTIRETNGLAYSSRNFLLTPLEKKIASKIYKLLKRRKKKLVKNKKFLKQTKTEIFLQQGTSFYYFCRCPLGCGSSWPV